MTDKKLLRPLAVLTGMIVFLCMATFFTLGRMYENDSICLRLEQHIKTTDSLLQTLAHKDDSLRRHMEGNGNSTREDE